MRAFEPKTFVRCKSCEDVVFSRYPGEWRACSCFSNESGGTGCYVDETRQYARIGGDPNNYEVLSERPDDN